MLLFPFPFPLPLSSLLSELELLPKVPEAPPTVLLVVVAVFVLATVVTGMTVSEATSFGSEVVADTIVDTTLLVTDSEPATEPLIGV